ncbi:MAG: hypothetical protein H6707_04410 [Deltaproteobacteria bacterium]|nr:hypothetical protein [Deltaproteobacteria bacterium]
MSRKVQPSIVVEDRTKPGAEQSRASSAGAALAKDVMLVHGRTSDGEGLRALRAREGKLELAELRHVKEGQPINDLDVISLKPRPEMPLLCDVEVIHEGARRSDHAGPARVSSAAYRRNWDAIFGAEEERGAPN